MSFKNPIPITPLSPGHESSSLRSPRDADAVSRAWLKHNRTVQQTASALQNVQQIQRQLDRMKRRSFGTGGGGWTWADPPEYNSDTAYDPDTVVYVSSDNPAVVDGVDGQFATPGVWVCVNPTDDGTGTTHLPTPQPDPATDGTGNWWTSVFWINIGAVATCPYG